MADLQDFINHCYDSSRWYHDRSDKRKRLDKLVMEELGRGTEILVALKEASIQLPEMTDFVKLKTISQLERYYSELRRMEQEITIANNIRMMVARRKARGHNNKMNLTK